MGHSVNFLAAQSECVQQISASGAAVLREECEELPVDERQQGLVARRPNPVPRAVKWIGHSRAEHVIQVDLSRQAKELQEGEVIEEQDACREHSPPHISQRLRLVHTCKKKHFELKRQQTHKMCHMCQSWPPV